MSVAPRSLTAVVAMTPAGIIGRDGDMPWRLSSDLRRFKRLTMGGVLIMGRKTFASIGRPLPGRETVVLTRQDDFRCSGVHIARDPAEAVALACQLAEQSATNSPGTDPNASEEPPAEQAAGAGRVFVVGGAEIYQLLLPRCDQVLLTLVQADVAGDTRVELDFSGFRVLEQAHYPAGPRDEFPTCFQRLQRESANLKKS